MPISRDALLAQLHTRPLAEVVQEHVFDGEPIVFAHRPMLYSVVRTHLSDRLGVTPDAMTIVGSGKIGYSLSPDSFGRPFSPTSDVDVVVVDGRLFDQIWAHLLEWRYPWHLRKWSNLDRNWGIARLEEFICGHCTPNVIKYTGLEYAKLLRPLRDLSVRWFDAFQSLGQHSLLASRKFNGRLYRTWDHAAQYHAYSLSEVVKLFPRRKGSMP